ncbi:isochorismate synthase [Streptomyces sp. NPDC005423]|uniref:isochorismate synthase n=1 Tax=Streptomyces sp. NPDC005423 TaxID=3155343 RepID=UPI0033B4E344
MTRSTQATNSTQGTQPTESTQSTGSVPGTSTAPPRLPYAQGPSVLSAAEQESLLRTFRRALEQARATQRLVLVSWAKPLTVADPVTVWSRGRRSTPRSFLWQSAWDNGSVVAIGTARELRGHGERRMASVRAGWTALCEDLVTGGTAVPALPAGEGPLALGGFAFSPDSPREAGRLPDALLWVPSLQVRGAVPESAGAGPARAELRLNATLMHDSDPEQLAEGLAQLADRCLRGADTSRRRPAVPAAGPHTSVELPAADAWKGLVRRATGGIRDGLFEKLVLAREVRVTSATPFDIPATVHRLRDANPGTTVFVVDHEEYTFLGATPEYLVRVEGPSVHALGLAGTAPRGATPREDAALERELVDSPKIQHEHDVVVRMLRDAFATACDDVEVQSPPAVVKLTNVQHLSTKVRGRRAAGAGSGILDFVELLHPTPALGGHPRAQALGWLSDNEGLDRSWYAGVVGWADPSGQGQFAVAIRSALLDGSSASLYAGCGLVADSDPEAEYAETCAKLRPMLTALGIE